MVDICIVFMAFTNFGVAHLSFYHGKNRGSLYIGATRVRHFIIRGMIYIYI